MKVVWLVLGVSALTLSAGCASTAPQVAASPDYLEQPIGAAVSGQCRVDGAIHSIRHAIRVDRPGRLAVTAVIEDGIRAEFLLKSPSGQFTQRVFTDGTLKAYSLAHSDATPGNWEVVVVCHQGVASYTMQVRVDSMTSIGSLE